MFNLLFKYQASGWRHLLNGLIATIDGGWCHTKYLILTALVKTSLLIV